MPKIYRTWIYHKTEDPKIVNQDEFESYKIKGWSDTPATFAKIKDFGIDETDASAVQVLGEAMEGVKDRLNGELNISIATKQELEDYALKHFNVDIDRRKKLIDIRKQVRELIGNS